MTTQSELADETTLAALGALMRHELEHARQQESLGTDFFDMDGVIVDQVLRFKAGGLYGARSSTP